MASKALEDVLGWVALTKAVNVIKDGIPNPFPSWLFEVRGEDKIIGDSVKFNRTFGTRKAARKIQYGGVARERELQEEDLAEAKFIAFGEERVFNPSILAMLREYESWDNANKAKRLVANNIKTQGTLFGNARIVAVATTLALGNIYFDSNGNILPTSAGSAETFGQQISAANNIGTILDGAGAGIFGATGGGSWAVASTDIPLQLRRLVETAAQQHGYLPKVALYGKNVPSYIQQNDYVLDYLARTPGMQSVGLKDNSIPDGLFGFEWVPVWTASYTKDDDTKVSLWPANGVTFLPGKEDALAFWSLFEGSNEVPTTINLLGDAMAALNSTKTVFGAYGYGFVSHKPVRVGSYMGDCFFPAVKLPDTMYLADVTS